MICLDWVELRLFPAAAGCHPCQPPKSPNATRTRGNWFRSRAPICLWGASFINLWPDLPGFTRINLRVPAGRDLGDGTTGGALPFLPFRCPPPTPNSLPSRLGIFSLQVCLFWFISVYFTQRWWKSPHPVAANLGRNDAVEFRGATPLRLWFGAPGHPKRWESPCLRVGREGASHGTRGGRAPQSNCLVTA